MKRLAGVLVAVVALMLALAALAGEMKAPTSTDPGFIKLGTLSGDWQGTDASGKPVRVSYRVTSGGSCVEETLVGPEGGEMVTMYYVDNKKLMMTHYCSMGNQPRMRCEPATADPMSLTFDFVDAGNLKSKNDPHMHKLAFRFQDTDHFTQEWLMRNAGKDMAITFNFARAKA